jgi:hypothetical protein
LGDVSEDDEDETDAAALLTGEIGRVDSFSFSYTTGAFDVEASVPPKQITHGPQRKGRGGKIKRW